MITKNGAMVRIVVISVIAVLIMAFLTVPSLISILDYNFYDEAESINSENMTEGNTVKVRFNCVLHLFGHDKMYYMKYFSENYYLLRIDETHFLYVHIPTKNITFWKGVPLFENLSQALNYKPEKEYVLIAKVKKFSPEMKEQLKESIAYYADEDFNKINDPSVTNLNLYLDIYIIKQVYIRLIGSGVFLIALIFLLIRTVRKYKELKNEEIG